MKTETDIHIDNLHKKAKELIKQGMEEDEVIEELKKEGIDEHYAALIIDNVYGEMRDRSDAWKLVFMGTCFIAGGIYINYSSYRIAVNSNATFFYLFWGIVVVGIMMLVRAFFLFRR